MLVIYILLVVANGRLIISSHGGLEYLSRSLFQTMFCQVTILSYFVLAFPSGNEEGEWTAVSGDGGAETDFRSAIRAPTSTVR